MKFFGNYFLCANTLKLWAQLRLHLKTADETSNVKVSHMVRDFWWQKNFRTEEVRKTGWGLAPRAGWESLRRLERPLVKMELPLNTGRWQCRWKRTVACMGGVQPTWAYDTSWAAQALWYLEDHNWVPDIGLWAIYTTGFVILLWLDLTVQQSSPFEIRKYITCFLFFKVYIYYLSHVYGCVHECKYSKRSVVWDLMSWGLYAV